MSTVSEAKSATQPVPPATRQRVGRSRLPKLPNPRLAVVTVAVAILLLALPTLAGSGWVGALNITLIYIVAVVGLQLVTGMAGQIQLGQAAFMGVGAYTTAALARIHGLPVICVLLGAALVSAAFGAIFGLAAARIRGFYLAVSSLAAQYLFVFLVINLPASLFGGTSFSIVVDPPTVAGQTFDNDRRFYFFALVVAAIMIFLARNLMKSRTGRAYRLVREDELAASLTGVLTFRIKAGAFALSAAYAGVAGALWAYYFQLVSSDQFDLSMSIWFLGMLIIGGLGSLRGAVLGVIVLRLLQELITRDSDSIAGLFSLTGGEITAPLGEVMLGALIVLVLVAQPRGLIHLWDALVDTIRQWPFRGAR
jgi:branched-chain amino acid transport system permease protein